MKEVVFIILNYQTFDNTIRQVNELLSNIRNDYYIIIVDNDSSNSSYNILKSEYNNNQYVDVIKTSENGGYAKGNNWGLKYASRYNPRFVCIINNDVHFSLSTIEALRNIYDGLDRPAVISPIQMLPGNIIAKSPELHVPSFWGIIRDYSIFFMRPRHRYISNTCNPNVQQVEWIPGAFMFINYNVFAKLGFFDEETFLYGEENLLAAKIKKNGLNNYIILNLQYIHEHSQTISTVFSIKKQIKMKYEGNVIFIKKYSSDNYKLKKTIMNIMCTYYTFCISCVVFFRNLICKKEHSA